LAMEMVRERSAVNLPKYLASPWASIISLANPVFWPG
jgi:hypothetical protein